MSDQDGPYDVIVVGAGPAGLVAGQVAAGSGLSTLILDSKEEIGLPVSCAEGISSISLQKFQMSPNDPWVMSQVKRMDVIWPKGRKTTIPLPVPCFTINVLDRVMFEKELARRAKVSGARISMRTAVTGLKRCDGGFSHVLTPRHSIEGRIIIGADGISSRIGRWAGIVGALPLMDIGIGIQHTIEGIGSDPDVIEIYLGEKWAPQGYAWVFPKGKGIANVGLYVRGDMNTDVKDLLRRFIAKRAPGASTMRATASCIPLAPPPDTCIKGNIILVGDAGRFTNAFNGAGIANAMITGRIAGNIIAKALEHDHIDMNVLNQYDVQWKADLYKVLMRKYWMKGWFYANDRNLMAIRKLELPLLAALKLTPRLFLKNFWGFCDY